MYGINKTTKSCTNEINDNVDKCIEQSNEQLDFWFINYPFKDLFCWKTLVN